MRKLDVFEVVPGIWCVREGPSLAYVVQLFPGAVLVDAGADPGAAGVMAALQSARVGMASVRALLLTHAHGHAASGAAALVARTGTALLASAAEAERLRSAESPTLLARLFGRAARPAVDGARRLADGEAVLDRFEVLATPGHTEGHLAFYFRPARALFTGDALLEADAEDPPRARASRKHCLAREDVELFLPGRGAPERAVNRAR